MSDTANDKKNVFIRYSDHILVAFFSAVLIISVILALSKGKDDLSILSDLSPIGNEGKYYNLNGSVMYEGNPVDTALVWVVLKDGKGNERSPSPPSTKTGAEGRFHFDSILVREHPAVTDSTRKASPSGEISGRDVQEISIYAKTKSPEMTGVKKVRVVTGGNNIKQD